MRPHQTGVTPVCTCNCLRLGALQGLPEAIQKCRALRSVHRRQPPRILQRHPPHEAHIVCTALPLSRSMKPTCFWQDMLPLAVKHHYNFLKLLQVTNISFKLRAPHNCTNNGRVGNPPSCPEELGPAAEGSASGVCHRSPPLLFCNKPFTPCCPDAAPDPALRRQKGVSSLREMRPGKGLRDARSRIQNTVDLHRL